MNVPDSLADEDGHWLAHGEWVAEHCAEQPEEPEPLFRVQPEANAATVARIHNDLLAENARLRAAITDAVGWIDSADEIPAKFAVARNTLRDALDGAP